MVTDTSSATSAADKPVYDNDQVIHALMTRDGGRPSVAWGVDIITYSISTGTVGVGDPEYTGEMSGYTAMSPGLIAAAREAFQMWDELIAVDLLEMDSWPDAHITFNYSSNTGGSTYTNYSYWLTDNAPRSDYKMADSDIWMSTTWSTQDQASDLYMGGYGYLTYLHEIGHALGLSHPGNYNGSASYALDATHYQDTRQYSVMSYFDAWENGSGTDHIGSNGVSYGATPLVDDILAIQAIYGADMTTRTGDTVYGFNSTAGRDAFDFTVNTDPVIAIWDAGGSDTLDASGFATDQLLDLTAGAFSSVGDLTNNVAIAYGATIEAAIGGAGNDTLLGNAADNALHGNAGADTLEGGDGADTLEGGAGADVLDGGAGRDLADFGASAAAVTVNLNAGTGSGGDAQGDTLSGIEDLAGSGFADTLIGDGADNSLQGNAGNDALIAGAGNDTLVGGAGADFLSGSLGVDILEGGDGNDVLRGGEEGDTIDGGTGYDWLLYNTAPAAVTVDLSQNAGLAGEALGDVITNVEHLIGTAFADLLTGDAGRNYLLGGDGADRLDGGDNDDTLKGQGDDDTLYGGAGNDVLIGGAGADALHGGAGGDWASYIEAGAGVSASLASGGISGEALGDSYDSIENLWGSLYDDTLTGDSATNLIRGDAGADTLSGGGGHDVLIGGAGADLYLFADGDGVDRVNGFEIGTDLVQISGAASGFADLVLGDFNGAATVTYAEGSVIVFSGIAQGDVSADMFLFA